MSDPRAGFTDQAAVPQASSISYPSSLVSLSVTLPEFWDTPTADPPEKAKPLSWMMVLPAVVGLMIVPRRLGPRISRSSWVKAVLIHILALLGTLAAAAVAGEWETLRYLTQNLPLADLTVSERLRLPGVLLVEALRRAVGDVDAAYAVAGVTGGTHVLVWLVAWLLMPLIAAGDRPGRAYLRAVTNQSLT
jgi:hypothetical protein